MFDSIFELFDFNHDGKNDIFESAAEFVFLGEPIREKQGEGV